MKELIMKNIKNKFELNDIENCTFTITDLSSYGVINFIPVINFKQCAILGICAEYGSCKNENDVLIYEPNMNLVLSFYHRIIDGKYAAEFIQDIKNKLLE